MGLTLLSQRCIGCSLGTVLEAHQELGLGRKTRPPPQRKRKTGQAAEAGRRRGGGGPCAQRSAGGRGPTAGPEQDEGRRAPREPRSPPVLTARNAGPPPPVQSAPHTSALHTCRGDPILRPHASPAARPVLIAPRRRSTPACARRGLHLRASSRPTSTALGDHVQGRGRSLSLSEQLSGNHTGALSGS